MGDKEAIVERLSGVVIGDLSGSDCNEIAAAIGRLSGEKPPTKIGQKRVYIEDWFNTNKAAFAPVGGGGGRASNAAPPAGGGGQLSPSRAPPPPPVAAPIGNGAPPPGGSNVANTPPRMGGGHPPSVGASFDAPAGMGAPGGGGGSQLPPLESVDTILRAIAQFRGGEIPMVDVHTIASAIQRFDHTRPPGSIAQKRVYIDDFFQAKTGGQFELGGGGGGGGGGAGVALGLAPAAPSPARPGSAAPVGAAPDLSNGEALLGAVHARIVQGGGWIATMDEAIPLARAVYNFTNMPTDGSDPQTYVADWYNWVRHTSQPLPPPAVPPHDDSAQLALDAAGGGAESDSLRREIAELNYQVRALKDGGAAPKPPGAAPDGGKENALWAMISSLSNQVQSLSSQVANTSEKHSQQQQQLMQQQLLSQQHMAQQQMAAMAHMAGSSRTAAASSSAPAITLAEPQPSGGAAGAAGAPPEPDSAERQPSPSKQGPAPGSPADIERQLLEYLAKFYDHGRDVPLDTLSKVCEHICELTGREVPRHVPKKRELARNWYELHKQQQDAAGGKRVLRENRGSPITGEPERPSTAPPRPGMAGEIDPSHLPTPRNQPQLLELLDKLMGGDPEFDLPLSLVPKVSSSIAELSNKNAPKLVRDKRDYIKEYYQRQLTIAGR